MLAFYEELNCRERLPAVRRGVPSAANQVRARAILEYLNN